ncbi:MAG: DUF2779 domain-containing protein [Arenibacter algicola]
MGFVEQVFDSMTLTKTDFLLYSKCPEALWLLKNRPNDYPQDTESLFRDKLVQEGYEVEEYARRLFVDGTFLPSNGSTSDTSKMINTGAACIFQASFITTKYGFARLDVIERNKDGTWSIYEVKSTTSIKTDKKHNHYKDLGFQKYVMERCGFRVSKASIIHLNGSYVRGGEIVPGELLVIKDVTEEILKIEGAIAKEIEDAADWIKQGNLRVNECSCRRATRSNHCDAFDYFNSGIPSNPIYDLGNIRKSKIEALLDFDIVAMIDIPEDFSLSERQQLQVLSLKTGEAIIERETILGILGQLKFPLHFIDYETYASAVPKLEGVRPHQHVPFQVSIHIMDVHGTLSHKEYLADDLVAPIALVDFVHKSTGRTGTFVSWHASFEKSRNTEMMLQIPEQEDFLKYMNDNMFDLEDIFKNYYMDYRFNGSTSIKKVLPVVVPQFSYDHLNIQDGTMALVTWGRMVMDDNFDGDLAQTKKDLLKYCEMDTLAMVEIYRRLLRL